MAGQFGQTDSNSALVNTTADGVPLQQLWAEIEDVTRLYNTEKDVLTSLLTYRTTSAADAVPQSLTPVLMEEASEFGAPRAIGPEAPYLKVGYTYKDYDLSSRLGWRFIRDASAEQIRATITRMIEADRFTCQSVILQRVFSGAEGSNEWQHTVYGAYNGSGTPANKPPAFMGKTFDANHVHQVATSSVDLDSEDLELMCGHVLEHGYGQGGGRGRLVALFNPNDVESSGITAWRAGTVTKNSKVAKFDFIPSVNIPPYLTSEFVVGAPPPADIDGVPVLGSYGKTLIVESNVIPAGYFAVAATHGANHPDNPIALREHEKPAYQGLRFIPGDDARAYPISQTFSMRGFGVGTRRRGAFAVAQLTAGSYTAPTSFAL